MFSAFLSTHVARKFWTLFKICKLMTLRRRSFKNLSASILSCLAETSISISCQWINFFKWLMIECICFSNIIIFFHYSKSFIYSIFFTHLSMLFAMMATTTTFFFLCILIVFKSIIWRRYFYFNSWVKIHKFIMIIHSKSVYHICHLKFQI